jgi:MATE family multidrug resistance protein
MGRSGQDVWPTRASSKELLRLAWPLILSNSCWTLQIILDRALLSQSGIEAVGAGMSAALLFWSALMLFQFTANYASTFVAQYTGAGQPLRVGAVIGQALWFAGLCGLSFLLLWPLAGPIVALGSHAAQLQALEVTYFRCLCFSALPTLLTAAACSFFAGRGDSRTVLLVSALGLAVNGPCAYVLIFGRLGFPQLGIAGAGWATVAGTSASAVLALALLLRREHRKRYGNGWGWGFDRALFARFLRFGVPNGIGVALDTLAFTVFILLVGELGKEELAATSIVFTLNLLAFLPMLGIAQAVEVLVGQRLGEDRPAEAERSTWTGLVLALALTFCVGVAYVLWPEALAVPFRSDSDPASWARVQERIPPLLKFVAVYCLFDSSNLVFAFALRGAGDTRFVTCAGLVLAWTVMVVPAWACIRSGLGLYAAWGFATLYIILLAWTFFWRFRQGRWRGMRVIETPAGAEAAGREDREVVPSVSSAG